jgi:thioredoxin-like negative regulator of GroEL
MSMLADYKNRVILPRVHQYNLAHALCVNGHPGGYRKRTNEDDITHLKKEAEFLLNNNLGMAIEVISSATAHNIRNDVVKAAAEVVMYSTSGTNIQKELAAFIIQPSDAINFESSMASQNSLTINSKLSALKVRVRKYPHSAISWVELAILYTILNQQEKATQALKVSLSLNNQNRYILRTAASLFVHLGDADKALYFLRNKPITKFDPMIISAEIAVSEIAGFNSKRIKEGRELIESKRFDLSQMTELCGNISTLEFQSGNSRKGQKLMRLALEKPNENSLAQSRWLEKELYKSFNTQNIALEADFEAESSKQLFLRNYRESLDQSKHWQRYQPLSSAAAKRGSYIAMVALGDLDESERICEIALKISPNQSTLRNNLAVCKAVKGQVSEAKELVNGIKYNDDKNDPNVLIATKGLIEYRSGNCFDGNLLYQRAINGFSKGKNVKGEALATYFWSIEESKIDSVKGLRLRKTALELAKKIQIHEILELDKKLNGKDWLSTENK